MLFWKPALCDVTKDNDTSPRLASPSQVFIPPPESSLWLPLFCICMLYFLSPCKHVEFKWGFLNN